MSRDDEREALALVVNRHLVARGWAATGQEIADVVFAAGYRLAANQDAEYDGLSPVARTMAGLGPTPDRQALDDVRALVWSEEAQRFREDAAFGRVEQPYASNRYLRLLDAVRDAVKPR